MFLVICYTANMQCSIFSETESTAFKKLTHLPLFEIKTFLTCHYNFFTKIFLSHYGRWDANVMTLPDELASKQIKNLQNTTVLQQNSTKTCFKRSISTTSDLES